jgi:hypothetical protein
MTKCRDGWVIHSYGQLILDSLPEGGSLLLAHTDLDWNPVRYLRHCAGLRTDVTHLSFQLMPFPWYPKQQQPLYPHVSFPDARFKGVSTDRSQEGNALLIRRFLQANGADSIPLTTDHDKFSNRTTLSASSSSGGRSGRNRSTSSPFPGGIYIDMQAVNEVEIGSGGQWRGLVLMPWGLLYRVFGPLPPFKPVAAAAAGKSAAAEQSTVTSPDLRTLIPLQYASFAQLCAMQRKFPAVDDAFIAKYPAGSWEYAAASVFYDAHYQLGLNLLTWAIDIHSSVDGALLPVLLDRLYVSTELLSATAAAVARYGTLSSSKADLLKNCAVAWLRLQALLIAAPQIRDAVAKQMEMNHELEVGQLVQPPNISQLR